MVPRRTSQLWVNDENHPLTVEGTLKICVLWCWDIFNGHLVPSYSNDAMMRDRRNNGYGADWWDKCRNSGICDVCESNAGSCCLPLVFRRLDPRVQRPWCTAQARVR